MFKFLKEKLKSAISSISEGLKEEGKAEELIVEKAEEAPIKKETEAKGFFAKLKEKFAGKPEEKEIVEEKEVEVKAVIEEEKEIKPKVEIKKEEKQKITDHKEKEGKKREKTSQIKKSEEEHKRFHEKEESKNIIEVQEPQKETISELPKAIEKAEPEKKGFFESIKEKITTTRINKVQFEKLFWGLELALMENNVAVEVIEKIKNDLKEQLVEKQIKRTKVEETVQETLKNSIQGLFEAGKIDLIEEIKSKKEKPYVIAFFGINGSGKTTSIAKLANMLKEKKISCVLAASDTFRAASIEQLQIHADKLGIKMIKHDYGSDPAAVAFDAVKHAKAKNIDAVLIDTAGRMHSNTNLIDEMKKIIRVAKPDLKIFVGESITGND